jgi:uncharacterized protein (DUF58 family)
MVASFFYSLWNRGLRERLLLVGPARAGPNSPVDLIPEPLLRSGPALGPRFEGDEMALRLEIVSPKGPRGPARLAGRIGEQEIAVATGFVPHKGFSEERTAGPLRRGRLIESAWTVTTGDLLGFFTNRPRRFRATLPLVLPVFTSFGSDPRVDELEATLAAPRAGAGTELFGVREYRPGDTLRRIHWRSSARRGELVVREYEPPGVRTLGILCDPNPPSIEAADQVARIAASEAWYCLRGGGRVVMWEPGCEPTPPSESRSLWAALEWLALYPNKGEATDLPAVSDVVVVTASAAPVLIEALEEAKVRGRSARAWAVGDVELVVDVPVQRAGLAWPL